MVKKILIGVGVLLVIAVAGVFIAPNFVDWNSYKGQIAAQVRDKTGRDMAIDGDISLSVLWTPTLSVHKVRFANIEGGSAPDMASLESLDVRLVFAPLDWLSKNFQVERIDLVQPTILLERLADGRVNWDFGTATAAAGGGGQGGGPAVRLDNITIKNGTLIYRDAAAGSEQKVEGVNVNLGAETLQGPFRADGSLTYQGVPVMLNLASGLLAGGQPAQISAQIGLAKTDATVKFVGTVTTAGPLTVSGKLDAGSANLAAAVDSLAPGTAAGMPLALDKPFKIGGDVNYAGSSGEVQNFSVALGDMTAAGSAKFAAGTPATAAVKLAINRLDLDKLLASAPASDNAASSAGGAGTGPFTLLQGIDASVDLAVDAIGYRGGVINDAHVVARLANGQVDVTQLTAVMPGNSTASVTGTLAAAGGAPKFTGALQAKADNLRGLLDWLQVALPQVPADRLRTVSMTSRVTATPATVEIADLDLKLDSSHVTGGTTVAMPVGNRANPAFGVGLAIDQLNLDAYLPPSTDKKTAANQGQKGGLPLQGLAPLAGIDANVELRVGKLTLNDQTMQGVHVDGTLQKGALTLRDLSVKDFAGGKGGLNGTITDLAGQPRFDTKFNLSANDAGKAFQLAGLPKTPPGKLGALKLDGSLAGGAQDVAYDVNFTIAGVGASGEAKGKASGIGAGIPRVDTTFNVKANDAGPLAALAGADAAKASRLGAVSLSGTATSGANDVSYNVALGLAGVGGQGQFSGRIAGLSGTPQVDTRVNFTAQKPAPLLDFLGVAGPAASKLGNLGIAGTMAGNADNMKLDLGLQGFGGNAKVAGTVAAAATPARFDLAISADHPEFRDLLAALVPGYQPQANQLGPFSLSAKAAGSTQAATLSDLSLKAGQTQLGGNMKYDAGGARPFVTMNLQGGLVDLTPFSPPPSQGGAGGTGGQRWSREPLDLSTLNSFDGDVNFTANRFVSGNTVIDNLQAKLALRDGTLTITQLTGNGYGGSINMTGKLVSRGLPTFNGHLVADNVNIGDVSGSRFVKGPVSINTDLTSSGASMADLMDQLQGTGTVSGTVTVLGQLEQMLGVAALSVVGQQLSRLTGNTQVQGMTDYVNSAYQAFVGRPNTLNGNFKITRGVLNTQDTSLVNDRAKALLSGDANLSAWTIGMLVNIFSMQFPDQPCMMVDLGGILDRPTPKPRSGGGCGGQAGTTAPFGGLTPGNLFGGALPGGNTGTQQQPAGVLPGAIQSVLPGVLGGGSGNKPVNPAPAPSGTQANPTMPGAEVPATAEQAPAQSSGGAAQPGAEQAPTQPGAEQAPAATATPAQPTGQDQTTGNKKKKKNQGNQTAPAAQPAAPATQPGTPPAQAPAEQQPAEQQPAGEQPAATVTPAPGTETTTQPSTQTQPTTPTAPANQGQTTTDKKKKKKNILQQLVPGQQQQQQQQQQQAPAAAPAQPGAESSGDASQGGATDSGTAPPLPGSEQPAQ